MEGDPLRELVAAYRRMLNRYRRIEAMSKETTEMLRRGCDVRDMNPVLEHKWKLYREIREEEEMVAGAQEWWKQSKQNMPAEECRELLSLLDAIGKTLVATIDQEEKCRAWLKTKSGPAAVLERVRDRSGAGKSARTS